MRWQLRRRGAILLPALCIAALFAVAGLVLLLAHKRDPQAVHRVYWQLHGVNTLVVILAQTRAHELTWEPFRRNVLEVLEADLAICASNQSVDDPFTLQAKYKWLYPEPEDWAEAFDYATGVKDSWRNVLKVKDQLFGGIKDPENEHEGSSAVLLWYRWFLLKSLEESGVIDRYDYFIVTRSDYYYAAPHPRIAPPLTNPLLIWVPEGEDYGGITDRHIVMPRQHVRACLSVLDPIIQHPDNFLAWLKQFDGWNLEMYLVLHFTRMGVWRYVRRFPRVMYAVRLPSTTTRWRKGKYVPEVGMIVKYETEYALTKNATRWEVLHS